MKVSDLCGIDRALGSDLGTITIDPAELIAMPARPQQKHGPAKTIAPGTGERLVEKDRRHSEREARRSMPKPGEAKAALISRAVDLLRAGNAERRERMEAEERSSPAGLHERRGGRSRGSPMRPPRRAQRPAPRQEPG